MHALIIVIPALPLLAAVLTAMLGPRLLGKHSHWPTILALVGSCVASALLAMDVRFEAAASGSVGYETVVNLWTWADVPDALPIEESSRNLKIAVALRADTLTSMMLVMVTFIATLIAIYSIGYMHDDRGCWRFFTYISLFVFSMTMLVSASNFVLLYVFWEAAGVCSYLLIGFWYEKPAAAAGGKKAFLVNRVGNFGFALALFLIWTSYGSLNFHDTSPDGAPVTTIENSEIVPGVLGQQRLASDSFIHGDVALAICLLLILGACGKSAQFPLHVWLPDAMEGPPPVSALVHAVTMVTAGVYMVVRCTPLFVAAPEAQTVVAVIGGATAAIAGVIAFTQTDLKRVLAYSTMSQLGYMFLAVGTGSLVGIIAGMFHLFTHAFFKALLFLGAGSVMHAMGGVIDMRRFGGLRRVMPITHWTFLFGALALAGVIPFAGFWSNDAVLAAVHARGHDDHLFENLYYLALATAFLTAMYTFRAFFLAFYGEEEIPAEAGRHAHESPTTMTVPLCILAAGALGVGFFHASVAEYLVATPSLAYGAIAAPLESLTEFHYEVAALSTTLALLGIALAAFLYLGDRKEIKWITRRIKPVYLFSHKKMFFDEIYTVLFVWPLLSLAWLAYWIDRYVIDGLVNLAGHIPPWVGTVFRSTQTGLAQFYAMLMVLGLLVLMGSLFL